MALKKRMTAEEHETIGKRLLTVADEMEDIGKLLLQTYGVSSTLGKSGERFYVTGGHNQLQELRSLLDDAWYQEGHERTGARNPYYGDYANVIIREACIKRKKKEPLL